jgi:hypothetical protein
VPLDIHPDQLLGLGSTCVDLEGSGCSIDGYSAARSAMRALYQSLTDIHDTLESNMVVVRKVGVVYAKGSKPVFERIIPPEKTTAVCDTMMASASRASAVCERSLGVIDEAVKKLDGFVQRKMRPSSTDHGEIGDIRQYVWSLKPEERASFIEGRVNAGDLTVVHATLNFSPYASGLEPSRAAVLRSLAEERFAPNEVRQREAFGKARATVERAMESYTRAYGDKKPKVVIDEGARRIQNLRAGAPL